MPNTIIKDLVVSVISYHDGLKKVEIKSEATSATFKTDKGFCIKEKRWLKNWGELPERV